MPSHTSLVSQTQRVRATVTMTVAMNTVWLGGEYHTDTPHPGMNQVEVHVID